MSKGKRPKLLMHPIRLEIYKFVSETPGTSLFDIVENLEIPQGTIIWHLRKMSESDLIDTAKVGGRRAYFSKALRGVDIEKAFVVLKSRNAKDIFLFIVNNSSCYQTEIAKEFDLHHDTVKHHCDRLEKVGLIETYSEGRLLRHKTGKIGKRLLEFNVELISHAYISHLKNKLQEECLTPLVLEYTEDSLVMKITCKGYDDVTLELKLKDWEFIHEMIDDEN